MLDVATFTGREAEIRDLFARLDAYDFEAVMRSLAAAKAVLEAYGNNDTLIQTVENDQLLLKNTLITAISNTHPERPNEVNVTNDRSCCIVALSWSYV